MKLWALWDSIVWAALVASVSACNWTQDLNINLTQDWNWKKVEQVDNNQTEIPEIGITDKIICKVNNLLVMIPDSKTCKEVWWVNAQISDLNTTNSEENKIISAEIYNNNYNLLAWENFDPFYYISKKYPNIDVTHIKISQDEDNNNKLKLTIDWKKWTENKKIIDNVTLINITEEELVNILNELLKFSESENNLDCDIKKPFDINTIEIEETINTNATIYLEEWETIDNFNESEQKNYLDKKYSNIKKYWIEFTKISDSTIILRFVYKEIDGKWYEIVETLKVK